MWHTGDGMGWWMVFVGLMWLTLWVAVIYFIVKASGGWHASGPVAPTRETRDQAIEIARRRYAEGEISKSEFDELRRDLMSNAA